jgi:hypothetical protein
MIDPFVLLAPVLLLAVVALLRFVGCNLVFKLKETQPIPPPIAVVQHFSNRNTNGVTSHAVAFPSSVADHNTIVVAVGWGNPSITASVTDSAGNTYSSAVGPTSMPTSGFAQQVFYAADVTGGNITVTVTYSASTGDSRVAIHELGNVNKDPLDVTAFSTGISGPPTSGLATTNFANELLFGWSLSNLGTQADTGAGFTQLESPGLEATEFKIVSSVDSYAATFTSTGGDWAAQLATFKAP